MDYRKRKYYLISVYLFNNFAVDGTIRTIKEYVPSSKFHIKPRGTGIFFNEFIVSYKIEEQEKMDDVIQKLTEYSIKEYSIYFDPLNKENPKYQQPLFKYRKENKK